MDPFRRFYNIGQPPRIIYAGCDNTLDSWLKGIMSNQGFDDLSFDDIIKIQEEI